MVNLSSRELIKHGGIPDRTKLVKQGIWLYFFLLIFEGAVRRYIPPLSTPFLIVRDPIALWVIYNAWKRALIPQNIYILVMPILSIFAIVTALMFGHGNFAVAIFGARPFLIHFPMLFIIGNVFNRKDVLKIGKATLWISIPMVVLVAIQFYSPQTAWINRSVGDAGDSGRLVGALGFFRPPGTFSFTTGLTLFYSFATPFVFYFLIQPGQKKNNIMIFGALLSLIASIPLSISRSLFFQVGETTCFLLVALSRKPKVLGRIMVAAVVLTIGVALLSNTPFFQTAIGAFSARFDEANGSEGGVEGSFMNRFLGGAIDAVTNTDDLPFFGYGIGMGTNVGSQLLTGGRQFLIAEGEWGRVLGEMGIVMGFTVIFLRCLLVYSMTKATLRKLAVGDLLPWLLMSFGFINILQVNLAQPTTLGFFVIIGGLILASLKTDKVAAPPVHRFIEPV